MKRASTPGNKWDFVYHVVVISVSVLVTYGMYACVHAPF